MLLTIKVAVALNQNHPVRRWQALSQDSGGMQTCCMRRQSVCVRHRSTLAPTHRRNCRREQRRSCLTCSRPRPATAKTSWPRCSAGAVQESAERRWCPAVQPCCQAGGVDGVVEGGARLLLTLRWLRAGDVAWRLVSSGRREREQHGTQPK